MRKISSEEIDDLTDWANQFDEKAALALEQAELKKEKPLNRVFVKVYPRDLGDHKYFRCDFYKKLLSRLILLTEPKSSQNYIFDTWNNKTKKFIKADVARTFSVPEENVKLDLVE
jgi:hypothetical protein